MKKIIIASAIALAAGLASAQGASPLYLGGAFGSSEVSVEGPNVDDSDTGFKIYGGYEINPMFALEIGYMDFGKATFTGGSVEVDAFYGAAVGRLEFTKGLTGVGRLGFANVDTKGRVFGASDSESAVNLYFGLGLEFALNKNFKLTGALDFTEGEINGDSGDVSLMSVGLQYNF